MIVSVVLLVLLVIALSYALIKCLAKNFEMQERLEDVAQQIEESLDILEVHHQMIHKKSKMEVFLDEPVVRELLSDIKSCKDAIHQIALKLYSSFDEEENEEINEKNDKIEE